MRIKTMNKKINEAKFEMSYVLGEFQLKLSNYISKNYPAAGVVDASCYKVQIKSELFLPPEVIDEIQEFFMLELKEYTATFTADKMLVDVWYEFAYKKLT